MYLLLTATLSVPLFRHAWHQTSWRNRKPSDSREYFGEIDQFFHTFFCLNTLKGAVFDDGLAINGHFTSSKKTPPEFKKKIAQVGGFFLIPRSFMGIPRGPWVQRLCTCVRVALNVIQLIRNFFKPDIYDDRQFEPKKYLNFAMYTPILITDRQSTALQTDATNLRFDHDDDSNMPIDGFHASGQS